MVGSVVWGQASIFGGKGQFRTLVVVLSRKRRRQGGRARSGGQAQARARPAAGAGERRWALPGEALVELVGRDGRERRISLLQIAGPIGIPLAVGTIQA